MNILQSLSACLISFPLLTLSLPSNAENAVDNWQIQRLYAPSDSQAAREQKGRITIYAGLTEADVNRAMDQQYGRIQYMMFIQTVQSDADGNPELDPESGEPIVEEDGCDD